MSTIEAAGELLRAHGQEHLLAFADELSPREIERLLDDIAAIDFDRLEGLIRSHVLSVPPAAGGGRIAPAAVMPAAPLSDALKAEAASEGLPHPATPAAYAAARRRGEELLAAGEVAALVVAGGAGTRLGFDGPKGCLPVTPVRHKPLFQVFAEQLQATARRYGSPVPWYVMTGPDNDEFTRDFFAANSFFGLDEKDVFFFTQGLMPALSPAGKVLLAEKGRVALSPDGHGGCLTALRRSGALLDMAGRGVRYISYFQVDNPLVRCVDPLFIGLHDRAGAEVSAKAVPKRDPFEKVGNFCLLDGRCGVIEYSDLPRELAERTCPDGTLLFSAGSIAIHVFSRAFVERLTAGGACGLPFHRAVKAVPCVDQTGRVTVPEAPNAVKLEMFVFDALPLAERTVILATPRTEEFSPVKNASGPDSLATCRRDQVARAAAWLEAAGASVPRDADGTVAAAIEISPLLALDAADLPGKVPADLLIRPGEEVYLE